jgi:excinuclease ABC subunit C
MPERDDSTEAGTGDAAPPLDAAQAPTAPGCYRMLDAKGRVIYVGKAKNLRARIRSYLNETDSRYTVKFLMRRAAKIDFLVTSNEKEALLLENSLIKQYKPRYNVQLKDDKTFISLRLDPREDFPRITVVRRYQKDGARYFGPYHDAAAVRNMLRHVQRLFPLRTCSDHVMHNRSRPCLYYQMKQCLAPCVGLVSREAYHEVVEQVMLILEGRSADLEKLLRTKIAALAEELRFEEAARLRDRLYDMRASFEPQHAVAAPGAEDRDVFGVYQEARLVMIHILFYRGGKMMGGQAHAFERCEMPLEELLSSLLVQYYSKAPVVPGEILVPVEIEDAEALGAVLTEQRGARVAIHHPQRGEKRALVDLAQRNAQSRFEERRLTEKANQDLLEQVQQALHLPRPPRRIECFDISNIQGTRTVASMVVFEDALPNKARYRRFAIRSVEGQDDFASMREALMRHFTRAAEEDDLPDLALIDGGRGQLGVASAVLKDLGLEDLPHAAIAKARAEEGGSHSPERFFIPGRANPIVLPQTGPVVQLLARIRDEAHRFAITYHRKKRAAATLRTTLTGIPGVGPARARALLNALGSVARIRSATFEELAAVPGVSDKLAQSILDHLER